jgi:hypothetical protein
MAQRKSDANRLMVFVTQKKCILTQKILHKKKLDLPHKAIFFYFEKK